MTPFHGFPRSPPTVTPCWHTLPSLFWGSKFPLPSREREGGKGFDSFFHSFFSPFSLHSLLTWRAGPVGLGALSRIHSSCPQIYGQEKDTQTKHREEEVWMPHGTETQGPMGECNYPRLQFDLGWRLTLLNLSAVPWNPSVYWHSPHCKSLAHLKVLAATPYQGPPGYSWPWPTGQRATCWVINSFKAEPRATGLGHPVFPLLSWPKHHRELSGWTRAPQADASMVLFNLRTSLLRWAINF